jgi:hypothetical protein
MPHVTWRDCAQNIEPAVADYLALRSIRWPLHGVAVRAVLVTQLSGGGPYVVKPPIRSQLSVLQSAAVTAHPE